MTVPWGREKRAARAVITRCAGTPHMADMTAKELRGMGRLERIGEVSRDDDGFAGVRWHMLPTARKRA
jgi:hypothetical protein